VALRRLTRVARSLVARRSTSPGPRPCSACRPSGCSSGSRAAGASRAGRSWWACGRRHAGRRPARVGPSTTVAPRRRTQAASGTHALRVGSMITVTPTSSAWSGSIAQSRSSSSGLVRNRRPVQMNAPLSSARLAWWAARQAISIPAVAARPLLVDAPADRCQRLMGGGVPDIREQGSRPGTIAWPGHQVPNRAHRPAVAHPPRDQRARSRTRSGRSHNDDGQAPVTQDPRITGRTIRNPGHTRGTGTAGSVAGRAERHERTLVCGRRSWVDSASTGATGTSGGSRGPCPGRAAGSHPRPPHAPAGWARSPAAARCPTPAAARRRC
jgi:hypothetical protein